MKTPAFHDHAPSKKHEVSIERYRAPSLKGCFVILAELRARINTDRRKKNSALPKK
jgi:hypothetical protein